MPIHKIKFDMNRFNLIFILIIIGQIQHNLTNGLKILGLFSHPGFSHLQVYEPIMKGLAKVGHDVTVLSHNREINSLPNYKSVDITGMEILKNIVEIEVSKFKFLVNSTD